MKIRYILLSLLLTSTVGFSQDKKDIKANKKYENLAYADAIEMYKKMAEKGDKSVEVFQKLGNSYFFNGNLKEASKWYGELFQLGQETEPEYYFRYAQSLKAMGDYVKADEYMNLFSKKSPQDKRAELFIADKDYLKKIEKNSNRYSIEDLNINSKYSDFGAAVTDNSLVFASSRYVIGASNRKTKWSNQPFLNFYTAKIDNDGSLSKVKSYSRKLNSKFHESTAVFTPDDKTVYFTRSNYINGEKRKDASGRILLKIFMADNKNGKWKNIKQLPFNSDAYSCAHPALSSDGKTLYFASDMPGTKGDSDIFKVSINDNGTFGLPINLGDQINTPGRETFPFLSQENELYFSSDGYPGLGGLDVFVVKMEAEDTYSNVFNVGKPVNSSADDFAFSINTATKKGYFSSNREGGKGYDDIYSLQENKKLDYVIKQAIVGTVRDIDSRIVLTNAKVSLYDENMKLLQEVSVDENGNYRFDELLPGKRYLIKAEKTDFEGSETSVTTVTVSGETVAENLLKKQTKGLAVGTDLAKLLNLKPIRFDLGKYNIRKDAAVELAKVIKIMKEYPNMVIDVRSHTDSRDSAASNMKLSDNRAKSTVAWIVKQGIDKSRITGKGYGESQLLNKCADGVKCNEAEHQLNRRSEFIIIKM